MNLNNNIKYIQTWCEYLTKCPNKQKESKTRYIMVGSWECHQCKYFGHDDHKNKILQCNYKNM